MKIGFIGFGKSANRYHMPFIDMVDEIKVMGYYTVGDSVFEMEYPLGYEIKRYPTTQDLFNAVDVVVINTPTKFHYQYAKDALNAGKNVIVEKPICTSVDELNELYDLARKNQVILTPYQNRRFDSDFLTIKEIIETKDIGEVIEIVSPHTQYRLDRMTHTPNQYSGSVYGHAVHFVDQIVSYFGEPDDVIYDITNQKNYYLGDKSEYNAENFLDDYYDIKLIYGNLRITLKHSQLVVKEQPRFIINATKATVEKYFEDQQERDLKLGLFPKTTENFADEFEGTKAKIYYAEDTSGVQPTVRIEEVETVKLGYQEFYKRFVKQWNGEGEAVVSEFEAKVVLNILTTVKENKVYKKLERE